jgi:hypothetical protein
VSDLSRPRAFKSAWFAKAAKKARIADAVLCKAIAQVLAGQADAQVADGHWIEICKSTLQIAALQPETGT